MEMVGIRLPCFSARSTILPRPPSFFKPEYLNPTTPAVLSSASSATTPRRSPIHCRGFLPPLTAIKREFEVVPPETRLYSFSPLTVLLLAALPGAGAVTSLFEPFVELVKSWNLPDWLVHWGHPGNMAVVLFAMGGYGTYLGFRIKYSDDMEEKANAKDLHPKLVGGMFFFFALGATGGVTSLLTSDKHIFERFVCPSIVVVLYIFQVLEDQFLPLSPGFHSPHAITGFIGLSLLTIQAILPSLFEGNPGLRNVHGILGSGIMTLFLVHAALGLQLGLSY